MKTSLCSVAIFAACLSPSVVRAADPGPWVLGFEAGDMEVETYSFSQADPGDPHRIDLGVGRVQVGTAPVVTGGMEVREDDGGVIDRTTLWFGYRDVEEVDLLDVAFPAPASGAASYAGLILFPKENVPKKGRLALAAGQSMMLTFDKAAGINNPALAAAEIRFVIQEGSKYFVSSEVFQPDRGAVLELADPIAEQWAPFAPGDSLFFTGDGAVFSAQQFKDVEAVGFLIVLPEATPANDPLFRLTRFKASVSAAK